MSMRPFQGRCHTCGHDHDSEAVTLRDVMDIGRAAQEQQVAELRAAVERVRGVLRELVSAMALFDANADAYRQHWETALAAARAELGEKT